MWLKSISMYMYSADAICDKPHHEPRSTYYNLDPFLFGIVSEKNALIDRFFLWLAGVSLRITHL